MMRFNDASGLNETEGWHHLAPSETTEQLQHAIYLAKKNHTSITVGGARHSMGGQSLPVARKSIAVELPSTPVKISEDKKSYTVGAGTRWQDVTRSLDAQGLSVKIMQSNNDFSVGGTISVNAHGWPAPFGPFGSSVKSFSMMLADGSIKNCSRTENKELFSHAIGGYGLFGILLEAELESVPNCAMHFDNHLLPAADFGEFFSRRITDPEKTSLRMAFGRLSLSKNNFLKETSAVFCHEVETNKLTPVKDAGLAHQFARAVYNIQKGNDFGKSLRWFAESKIGPYVHNQATRNNALHTSVDVFRNSNGRSTDILHEYFVPPEKFEAFLESCRRIIPDAGPELLNVTLRYLDTDKDSVMSFSPAPRIAAVMLFDQKKTPLAEQQMERMTRGLIDAALEQGGSYYLPYRLHATQEQFQAAYPMAKVFFENKRRYDSSNVFSNSLYLKYGQA